MHNTLSSQIRVEYIRNDFSGVQAAYVIELILGRDSLSKKEFFEDKTLLGINPDNYIYWYGVIVTENGRPISNADWVNIKKLYQSWWEKNKSKTIEALRKEWKRNIKPLTGSHYYWE